jgi:predicted RNA-binding protein with PIN domain
MPLVIDGYNLLHAVGMMGPNLGHGELEKSRLALVRFLAESLEPGELAQTTVVFDSVHAPPGLPPVLSTRGLTVRFAVGYESADALIEELIRAEPAPRRLEVVSSDHRIQRAARRRKAAAVASEEWYEAAVARRRSRPRAAPPVPARPEVPLVEEEVAYWLGQFGGESIVEQVRAEEEARQEAPADEPSGEGPRADDPYGGKLSPEDAEAIDNPFPPGYGDDLLEDEPGP